MLKRKKEILHYGTVSAMIDILLGAHVNPGDKMMQSKQNHVKFQQIVKHRMVILIPSGLLWDYFVISSDT